MTYYPHIQGTAAQGFIKFCKFTTIHKILLAIIALSAFRVTGILTANRLLSSTTEETDFLNGLPFAIHRRMDVQPQRCRNIRVTQHFTDAFNVNPGFNAPGRVSMTQRVITALSDTAPPQNRFKIILMTPAEAK